MEDIYANVDGERPVNSRFSTNQTGNAVVVCLGLLSGLLLAGLIGVSVHCHFSVPVTDNLTSLTEDRDLLNTNRTEMTKELEKPQSFSKLHGIFLCEKTCHPGWRGLGCACYLVSTESGSWDKGREDCRNKGADLVVINSPEEQAFLIGLTRYDAWLGLTDKDQEGTWRWIDGSPLTLKYWGWTQPDNGLGLPEFGEEDCAQHTRYRGQWNDFNCSRSLRWICEKNLTLF